MRTFITLMLAYSFSVAAHSASCFKEVNWTQCTRTEGVQTCSARYGKSNIRAYQGTGTLDAPLENIVSVFLDTKNYPKWQVDLKQVKIIREISPVGKQACQIERLENSFGTKPWVFRWTFWVPNAEFVYKALYQLSPDGQHFSLALKSDDNVNIPFTKGYQRGEVETCYQLQRNPDPKKTTITTELWVNLKNDIAPSKINASLTKWPNQVIQGLQKRLSEPATQKPTSLAQQFYQGCISSQ